MDFNECSSVWSVKLLVACLKLYCYICRYIVFFKRRSLFSCTSSLSRFLFSLNHYLFRRNKSRSLNSLSWYNYFYFLLLINLQYIFQYIFSVSFSGIFHIRVVILLLFLYVYHILFVYCVLFARKRFISCCSS